MLNCRDILNRADDLLAGELAFRDRVRVHMHLLICRHCRRYVRQLEKLTAVLKHLRQTRPLMGAAVLVEKIRIRAEETGHTKPPG